MKIAMRMGEEGRKGCWIGLRRLSPQQRTGMLCSEPRLCVLRPANPGVLFLFVTHTHTTSLPLLPLPASFFFFSSYPSVILIILIQLFILSLRSCTPCRDPRSFQQHLRQ